MRPCRERILAAVTLMLGNYSLGAGITPPIDGADGQGRRLSPQDLMSRRADGRLTALLKLDVQQRQGPLPPAAPEPAARAEPKPQDTAERRGLSGKAQNP